MNEPEYLQLDAAARLVSVSKTTLRRAIAAGHLPARVMTLAPGSRTRRVLVRRADLLAWVERSLPPAAAPDGDLRREAAALVNAALVDAALGGRRRT